MPFPRIQNRFTPSRPVGIFFWILSQISLSKRYLDKTFFTLHFIFLEMHLGETVTECVISVPAYFDEGQRQATKDAATIAGMEVIVIFFFVCGHIPRIFAEFILGLELQNEPPYVPFSFLF